MRNSDTLEQFRRRMGEAALLPPEDPARLAVVQQISLMGNTLEREWLALIQENERLRLDLLRVSPPIDLHERLLSIPDRYGHPRMAWFGWRGWMLAAAALVAITFAVAATTAVRAQRQAGILREFACLAMASHEARPQPAVRTAQWQHIIDSFTGELPYPIQPVQLPSHLRLEGGAVMTLGGEKVLCTRWTDGTQLYSLYQFCAKDFGLKHPLKRRSITPMSRTGSPCQVTIWSEDHCDYALVVEKPTDRV